MTDSSETGPSTRSRRAVLAALGATALAGCNTGSNQTTTGPAERTTRTTTTTRRTTTTSERTSTTSDTGIPSREAGIEEWGARLNDHAKEADIDWTQFADQDITLQFKVALHPYATTLQPLRSHFEHLTGIEVEFEVFSADQYWIEAENTLREQNSQFDGIMVGLWPAGGYHYGNGNGGWLRDLNQFIEDPTVTDKDWLHMEDFRDGTLEQLTFPDGDGSRSLVGFPNTIEVSGCLAIDVPTFERLGLAEPTTVAEMETAAKQISDSDEVEREGIVSRTSSSTLSAADWATMFKTYGADWIDRQSKTAALNSEQGVASLERFGRLLRAYGPENPGTYDWYASNTAFSEGRTGMLYGSPQRSGIISREQIERTKFLPPMRGPNGRDPVVNTWTWATGISQFSDNPEAAWLFIQWANSREANYLVSTKQWQGDYPRVGYARWNYVFDRVNNDPSTPSPPEGYENAFRNGMDNVPASPPPAPADTPQSMEIMSQAARAMSTVVQGDRTAQGALDAVAPRVTKHAKEIPDRYVAYLSE